MMSPDNIVSRLFAEGRKRSEYNSDLILAWPGHSDPESVRLAMQRLQALAPLKGFGQGLLQRTSS